MTTDERIERLAVSQEKTQVMLAEIVDSVKRLERIALAHSPNDDDLERRLTELEGRRFKKPQ